MGGSDCGADGPQFESSHQEFYLLLTDENKEKRGREWPNFEKRGREWPNFF